MTGMIISHTVEKHIQSPFHNFIFELTETLLTVLQYQQPVFRLENFDHIQYTEHIWFAIGINKFEWHGQAFNVFNQFGDVIDLITGLRKTFQSFCRKIVLISDASKTLYFYNVPIDTFVLATHTFTSGWYLSLSTANVSQNCIISNS